MAWSCRMPLALALAHHSPGLASIFLFPEFRGCASLCGRQRGLVS